MNADSPISERTRVGVIGLGSMGLPMARRLLERHGALVIHSRTPKQELLDAGARWASTPRELAEQCDALLVMLPDLPQLEPMLDGPDGLLAAEDLVLMLGSTSSPAEVRRLGARLADRTAGRVRLVDCPVSGGEQGAQAGTLSIMAGGDEADVAQCARILAPCGTVHHLGPLGAGETAKACNQLVVAATMLALAEATVIAERSGIVPDALFDVLEGGYADSALLRAKRDQLAAGDDEPGGIAAYMVKDLRFAADTAERTHTRPMLLPTLRKAFDELVERGLGQRDLVVARRLISER